MPLTEMKEDEVFPADEEIATSGETEEAPESATEEDATVATVATEEETEDYGKRVQKRIDQLTARWKIEQQEKANLQARLTRLEEERAQERAREGDQTHEVKLAEVKRRLKEASELNDADAQQAAIADLTAIQVERRVQEELARRAPVATQNPTLPSAELEWQKRNAWYGKPQTLHETQLAQGVYRVLVAEGYDPADTDLYQELDARLAVAAPTLAKATQSQRKGTIPVASGSRGVGASMAPTPGKLTKADLASMQRYGFDPNSAKDRKTWLNRNSLSR